MLGNQILNKMLMLLILADTWTALQWGAWVLVVIAALGWAWGCRGDASQGGVNSITLTQAMFLCALAAVFPFTGWNKLHILWAAPAAIFSVYVLILIPGLNRLLGALTGLFGLFICGKALRNRLEAESPTIPLRPETGQGTHASQSARGTCQPGPSLFGEASPSDENIQTVDPQQEIGMEDFFRQSGIDYLNFIASRKDIVSGSIDEVLTSLRKLLAPKVAIRFRNRVALGVHGYDDDPRELPQIPEVRAWMAKLDQAFPYWFFYLDMEHPAFAFVVLSLCECDMRSDGIRVNEQSLAEFVQFHLVAMREMCAEVGDAQETVAAMTTNVLRMLAAH